MVNWEGGIQSWVQKLSSANFQSPPSHAPQPDSVPRIRLAQAIQYGPVRTVRLDSGSLLLLVHPLSSKGRGENTTVGIFAKFLGAAFLGSPRPPSCPPPGGNLTLCELVLVRPRFRKEGSKGILAGVPAPASATWSDLPRRQLRCTTCAMFFFFQLLKPLPFRILCFFRSEFRLLCHRNHVNRSIRTIVSVSVCFTFSNLSLHQSQ